MPGIKVIYNAPLSVLTWVCLISRLQGVLEKLRSVAVGKLDAFKTFHTFKPIVVESSWSLPPVVYVVVTEPASLTHELQSDSDPVAGKSRSSVSEDGRVEELKVLTVSSSHAERTEARVSSSAHESRCQILSFVPCFISVNE